MKFVKTAIYWLPFISYMALIFYLSSLPQPSVPMSDVWNIDKVYHIIEYSIFSFLAFYAFVHTSFNTISNNAIILAVLFASFFGATDELHQLFVPGRDASVIDWGFDVAGGFVGVFCALIWNRIYQSWIVNRKLQIERKE